MERWRHFVPSWTGPRWHVVVLAMPESDTCVELARGLGGVGLAALVVVGDAGRRELGIEER